MDDLDRQVVAMNQAAPATEEDRNAHQSWCTNRTVELAYVLSVLGNPEDVTIVRPVPPMRVLTKEQIRDMVCPFPPELGYE